jgi:hypothetical protein
MDPTIIISIAVAAVVVSAVLYGQRRLRARQGRFVWLRFGPMLAGGVVILWASARMIGDLPLVGVPMAIGAVIYLALIVRFLIVLSRTVTATAPQDDLGAAITGPLVDYTTSVVGLLLIGGLVALVGLIIWGVSQAT